MIKIVGTTGTIHNIDSFVNKLLLFSQQEKLVVQAFDAAVIYGTDHLISATMHAKRAFEQKTNATNSLALEILLYAAGERQIQKAIKKIGIQKGKQSIAFVLTEPFHTKRKGHISEAVIRRLCRLFHLTIDQTVLDGDRDTLERFGITDRELSTIPEENYGGLILEKVALVDVIKK